MRWLKFTAAGQTSWGIVEGDKVIAVSGDPFGEWQRAQQSHALTDVRIELPVMPRTFYCVGLNYLKHLTEAANKRGEVPNVPDRPEIGYRHREDSLRGRVGRRHWQKGKTSLRGRRDVVRVRLHHRQRRLRADLAE